MKFSMGQLRARLQNSLLKGNMQAFTDKFEAKDGEFSADYFR